jgi:branched-chain amino acid transport system ATP-binding protein
VTLTRIAQSGIAYIPEDREIFASLSVKENLALAARGKDHEAAFKFVHSLSQN